MKFRVRFPAEENEPEVGVLEFPNYPKSWYGGYVNVTDEGELVPARCAILSDSFFKTKEEAENRMVFLSRKN